MVRTMTFRVSIVSACLLTACLLSGQEIKYINLSFVTQQTDLRYPPANCKEGTAGTCGGYGGVGIADGASDRRDPRMLGVYLLNVSPTEIDPNEPTEIEFKLLNTGSVPIDIPISPDLSNLQPADESIPFTYFSLSLAVMVDTKQQDPAPGFTAYVQLYGAPDHRESMATIKPGEWIRVKDRVKIWSCPSEPLSANLRGGFWLRTNTYHPHAGGGFTEMQNLPINSTSTPAIAVHLLCPSI